MRNIENKAELEKLIESKEIKDVNISLLDLNNLKFDGCTLSNVIFSEEEQSERELKNITFKSAELKNVSFQKATLIDCNFDFDKEKGSKSNISQTSFKHCTLLNCRFRKVKLDWCDFRYTEINAGTFEESSISYCDFYRAFFGGVILFRKAIIKHSSINYTNFDTSVGIRKENLYKGKIIQEYKYEYEHFLKDWEIFGTGVRTNNQNSISDWEVKKSVEARYADAEEIYKTLNGFWAGKGFLSDANWAYVKGRTMELGRMWKELISFKLGFWKSLNHIRLIIQNIGSNLLFGYGESMQRMIMTYILLIFVFAYLFNNNANIYDYSEAVILSVKNMVGVGSENLSNISPFVDFLNLIQTSIGIVLTGIFGFILGNKIRNK